MLILWKIFLIGLVTAKPQFNSVNKYDAHGNLCPLRTRTGNLCPQLCVSDVQLCPSGLGDDGCPDGQHLCIDGSCSKACGDIPARKNPCGCSFQYPPEQSKDLKPCMAFPEVTIDQYDPNNIAKTTGFCSDKFNISGEIPLWGRWSAAQELPENATVDDGRRFWSGSECPSAPKYRYTYDEPLWIGVFSCVGAEALILLLWISYKFLRENSVRRMRHRESGFKAATAKTMAPAAAAVSDKLEEKSQHSDDESKTSKQSSPESQDDEPMLQIKGFKDDFLGWIGFISVLLVSVGWIVWIGFWIGDYYGTLGDEPDTLSHYNSELLDETIIPIWIFAICWLVVCCQFQKRMRNFFRIECLPSEGTYVQIERELLEIKVGVKASKLVAFAKHVEEGFSRLTRANFHVQTCKIERTPHTKRRYFNYMCTQYVFNDATSQYAPYNFDLGTTNAQLRQHTDGLTSEEAQLRFELVGRNFIAVDAPNYLMGFVYEVSTFFYLYQIMVMWIYWYWNYYIVGLVSFGIIMVSAIVKVVVKVRSEKRVKRMAEHEEECRIFRDGQWLTLSTMDLVPGDVFKIEAGAHVPCDAAVLGGNIVVDESTLSGEPLPLKKVPVRNDQGAFDKNGSSKINTLFAGTTATQAMPTTTSDGSVSEPLGLCLDTGTHTLKGNLVKEILFPQPISFIFDEQLRLVFGILILYAIIIFVLAMVFYETQPSAAFIYAIFSMSQLISPLLPAALVMGQSVAANRLKKKGIYCVNLPRITMAGKVSLFCFDKTGTLTKEGLEFYGGLCVRSPEDRIGTLEFDSFIESFDALPDHMRSAAATCHGVAEVEGGLRIGNPVDLEMFATTQGQISKNPTPGALDTISVENLSLDIVKRFEFIHSRASMSVAVRDPRDGHVHVYVKGSFEKVKEHLDSTTVPDDYLYAANRMARQGGYVLAVGHRDLGDISVDEMEHWTRDDMENGSELVGFIVFKNMLKEDTPQAIAKLKRGSTRTIMITGDTALTGVFIGKQAGLMNEAATVYLGDIDKSGDLFWTDVDREENVDQAVIDQVTDGSADGDIELAMTGKAFNYLIEQDQIRSYILYTRVFARMLPADKLTCIRYHMERGITAMCGDGGNDTAALRTAHAGIALANNEASIVSPFSSSNHSIESCVELLIQGRSALASSLAGYMYLICYGQTMTVLKTLSFYFSISPNQNIWIYIDAFINTTLSLCVSYSGPAKRLSKYRPTAQILGPQMLTSAMGTVFINYAFVAGAFGWLYSKQWFRCNEFDSGDLDIAKWWLLADNYETAILAIVSLFQFANNAMVVNFGYLFRRRWYRNYPLLFLWAVYISINSIILLADPNWLGCRFRINCGSKSVLADKYDLHPDFYIEEYGNPIQNNIIPTGSRYELWGICIGNMVATILWQLLVALYPVHSLTRKKRPLRRLQVKL
ncbi:hypothetical protein EV183_001631 [Coemansia sp. RSA 2336]|nr:hypothetical protein EV183_001631 [Coemansia sp. RSA 2336]